MGVQCQFTNPHEWGAHYSAPSGSVIKSFCYQEGLLNRMRLDSSASTGGPHPIPNPWCSAQLPLTCSLPCRDAPSRHTSPAGVGIDPGDCGKTSFNSRFHTTSCLLRNGQGCPFKERKSFHCSCRDSCKVFNRILFHRKKDRLPLTEAQPVDTSPEPHKKKLKRATFWGGPLSSGTALFSFVFNYETLQTYRKV